MDCVLKTEMLFEMRIDEWLLMDNMGAYTLAMASGFNGLGFTPVKYIVTASSASTIRNILELEDAKRQFFPRPPGTIFPFAAISDYK